MKSIYIVLSLLLFGVGYVFALPLLFGGRAMEPAVIITLNLGWQIAVFKRATWFRMLAFLVIIFASAVAFRGICGEWFACSHIFMLWCMFMFGLQTLRLLAAIIGPPPP